MAVPPGSAQDEPDHYVKALGAGGGELFGRSPEEFLTPFFAGLGFRPGQTVTAVHPPAGKGSGRGSALTPAESRASRAFAWALASGRDFVIPTRLFPDFVCGRPDGAAPSVPFRCRPAGPRVHRSSHGTTRLGSHFGTYPPLIYVVTGALMRLARNPTAAYRIGRFTSAVIAWLLVGFAIAAMWRRRLGVLSLVGLMLAVTPTALYEFSVLNPSGAEIASALCFAACLLRLLEPPTPVPLQAWIGCGLGGAVLALSRPLGPGFVVYMLLVATLLTGRTQAVAVWRAHRRAVLVVGAVIVVALGLALVWQQRYEVSYPLTLSGLGDDLGSSIKDVPTSLRQSIGTFVVDIPLPAYGWVPWAVMTVGLVAISARLANRGERIRLSALLLVTFVALVALADFHSQTGGVVYGRYAFPFLVPVPLYAGSIAVRRHERVSLSVWLPLIRMVIVVVAAVHAVAWWSTARWVAVGENGPLYFAHKALWHPPGGWSPWIALVVFATVIYVLAAARPTDANMRLSDVGLRGSSGRLIG